MVKEAVAITMIGSYNVVNTSFEQSHLLAKLKKEVACASLFELQLESKKSNKSLCRTAIALRFIAAGEFALDSTMADVAQEVSRA